jgi:phospholipid/cholesterol/gamma-HCH transport system substrate-binding protein
MSNRQANSEFSAGNARFALYLLLFAGVLVGLWLTFHPKSPMRAYDDYYLHFPETGTLGPGSKVQVLGLLRGYVESIQLREDGVVAHARIETGLKIPKDSRFRVVNVGLLGERNVEIRLGTSTEFFQDEDSASGGYDLGSTRLIYLANSLFKSADSLLQSSLQVWDSTMGNPEVIRRLKNSKQGAMESVDQTKQIASSTKDSLLLLHSMLKSMKTQILADKDELKPQVEAVVSEVKSAMIAKDSLVVNFETLSADISWLNEQMSSKNGTLGAVFQNQEFHQRLSRTTESVKTIMGDIRKNGLNLNVDIF